MFCPGAARTKQQPTYADHAVRRTQVCHPDKPPICDEDTVPYSYYSPAAVPFPISLVS